MGRVKAILAEAVTPEEHEAWLWDIDYPDLLANPYLDKVELNTIARRIAHRWGRHTAGASV
jgi:hypothetical protein